MVCNGGEVGGAIGVGIPELRARKEVADPEDMGDRDISGQRDGGREGGGDTLAPMIGVVRCGRRIIGLRVSGLRDRWVSRDHGEEVAKTSPFFCQFTICCCVLLMSVHEVSLLMFLSCT